MNILDNFKSGGAQFEELGLPKKLGILLYGEAGTGKSTAIKTIASYLGKDIYFIDLKGVKTNRELKDLFDHVNKQCQGGGIMVY